jgi:hypothetical protein
MKVLIKFKLEQQTVPVDEWRGWIARTPYFETNPRPLFPRHGAACVVQRIAR